MGAISCANNTVTIDRTKCNNCGRCVKACPTEAWEGQSGYIVSFGGLLDVYKRHV